MATQNMVVVHTPDGQTKRFRPKRASEILEGLLASGRGVLESIQHLDGVSYTGTDEVPAGEYNLVPAGDSGGFRGVFRRIRRFFGTRSEPYACPEAPPLSGVSVQHKRKVSGSAMVSQWKRQGWLVLSRGQSWLAQTAPDGSRGFADYWAATQDEYRLLAGSLSTVACCKEPDGSYQAAGQLLQAIFAKFQELARATVVAAHVLINRKVVGDDGTQSVPDVAFCFAPDGVLVAADDTYNFLAVVQELKKTGCSPAAIADGLSQVLDRAEQARQHRNLDQFILPGAVSDGTCLHSVIVTARRGRAPSTAVYTPLFTLTDTAAGSSSSAGSGSSNGSIPVDGGSPAYAELVFHIWQAMEQVLRLRAGAEPIPLSAEPEDQLTIQIDARDVGPTDQSHFQVLVTGAAGGSVFTGEVLDGGCRQKVYVKLGHALAEKALAVHMHLPWEPWHQVERELIIREQLQNPIRNLAQMVACGVIAHSSRGRDIVGRTALVLGAAGSPVIPPGDQPATLPGAEVLVLLRCLLRAVVDLYEHGVYHCDIRPSNVGFSSSGLAEHRFYLYDLGGAAAVGVDRLAAAVLPGDQRPGYSLASYSPIADLRFSSVQALLGKRLDASCDLQSVVYTALVLQGEMLPWEAAAAAGDLDEVIVQRQYAACNPGKALPGISHWPAEVQQMAVAAVECEHIAMKLARDIVG